MTWKDRFFRLVEQEGLDRQVILLLGSTWFFAVVFHEFSPQWIMAGGLFGAFVGLWIMWKKMARFS